MTIELFSITAVIFCTITYRRPQARGCSCEKDISVADKLTTVQETQISLVAYTLLASEHSGLLIMLQCQIFLPTSPSRFLMTPISPIQYMYNDVKSHHCHITMYYTTNSIIIFPCRYKTHYL